jgi:hypothetical protein
MADLKTSKGDLIYIGLVCTISLADSLDLDTGRINLTSK